MVNLNNLKRLKDELQQELVKNWRQIDDNQKKDTSQLTANCDIFEKNVELTLRVKELEQEKYVLRKTVMAELANDVHATYQNLITEKETKVKELEERVHEDNKCVISLYKENDKLKKELQEKELRIRNLESEVEESKEEADCHLKALDKAEQWKFKQLAHKLISLNRAKNMTIEYNEKSHNAKIKVLEKEVSDKTREVGEKSEKIEVLSEDLGVANNMVKQLQTEAEEKDSRIEWFRKELDNSNAKLKETEDLLYLSNKPLPFLPKKQNKFKLAGTKLKNKLSQLAEKTKSQTREMVARIEVKSK